MKVAVTAANGKLGSEIINALIKEIGKDNVIGIARTPSKAKHLGVEIRKGDYNSQNEFEIALDGIDAVIIISGMDTPEKRIEQHRNIIEAAKNCGLKKIVYTSILGDENKTAFAPVILSNRQTEEDVKKSGLEWVIGRNSLYIEPDLEYIKNYIKKGNIWNCAGEGKCTYTSRNELAYAYSKMLIEGKHNNSTYNLGGDPITQKQLTKYINEIFNTNLFYKYVSVENYTIEQKKALGDFIGTVIAGIYDGIKNGAFDVASDYEKVTGRKHKRIKTIINEFKNRTFNY